MLKKLMSNYNLSNILCKVLFVITFAFSNWQAFMLAANIFGGDNSVVIAIISALLLGVVLVFMFPLIVNFLLNYMRLYSIPRLEYILIVEFFFTIGFFINGLLSLIHLFTPILLGWGTVLFPFLVSVGCTYAFYRVTAKMYFNDVTVVYYFKALAVIFFVASFVMGVL